MFYTNPAHCIQSVSMVMESVIVELRHSPSSSPYKVEAGNESEPSLDNSSALKI